MAFKEFNWLMETMRPGFDRGAGFLEPLVQVRDIGEEVVVTADLPYVKDKGDIQLNITEDSLEISASMGRTVTLQCLGTIHSRTSVRSFKKVTRLPARVKAGEAKARFSGGILEVRVPKKMEKRRIEVE